MKVAIAQIKPQKGDVQKNIEIHQKWIEAAAAEKSDLVLFSELSLTSYEPKLAAELAISPSDSRLDIFQRLSNTFKISIGIGAPLRSEDGILISMIIFQPQEALEIYSKQKLHADELPYFIEGKEDLILTSNNKRIGLAICYESLLEEHAESVSNLGAQIYIASVSKDQKGVEKGLIQYPRIARNYSMPVLMSNSIGFCDSFESRGQSAVWNSKGVLINRLTTDQEGLLVFDTETEEVIESSRNTIT
jgi:predicted amidohydrolase